MEKINSHPDLHSEIRKSIIIADPSRNEKRPRLLLRFQKEKDHNAGRSEPSFFQRKGHKKKTYIFH
jgi:hypothetical protein